MDKLRYILHGIPFDLYQKEYGLYLMAEGANLQYQVIKPHQFVRGINNLPREEAIDILPALKGRPSAAAFAAAAARGFLVMA